MQACARAFAQGIQTLDARLSVKIYLDTATQIMRCRSYRYIVFSDIDAQAETFLIYIREVLFSFFRIFMCYIKVYMVFAAMFHFAIDGTCYDIAWSERQTRIVLLHELLACQVTQYTSVTTHRLSNKETRTIARMEECCRMELNELHILYYTFGTIYHCDTVACSNKRIGSMTINSLATAGSHYCNSRQESIYLASSLIKHIRSKTLDARSMTGNNNTQMMLSDNFYRIEVAEYSNVRMTLYFFYQTSLYLCTGIILMMQDTEF